MTASHLCLVDQLCGECSWACMKDELGWAWCGIGVQTAQNFVEEIRGGIGSESGRLV